jgi:hypothetical protein
MQKYLPLAFILAATSVSAQELSISQKLELRTDCKADISRLCPGITPGGGRLIECIKAKKDQLSKPCAATIAKVMASRQQ